MKWLSDTVICLLLLLLGAGLILWIQVQVLTLRDLRAISLPIAEASGPGVRCFMWHRQLSCVSDPLDRSAQRPSEAPMIQPRHFRRTM